MLNLSISSRVKLAVKTISHIGGIGVVFLKISMGFWFGSNLHTLKKSKL
jgi:hypothetical protein